MTTESDGVLDSCLIPFLHHSNTPSPLPSLVPVFHRLRTFRFVDEHDGDAFANRVLESALGILADQFLDVLAVGLFRDELQVFLAARAGKNLQQLLIDWHVCSL